MSAEPISTKGSLTPPRAASTPPTAIPMMAPKGRPSLPPSSGDEGGGDEGGGDEGGEAAITLLAVNTGTPPMVAVARQAALAKDDNVLRQFFDCFSELAQTPVPVLTPHITTVVSLSLEVMKASDDDLERTTRDGGSFEASRSSSKTPWTPR